MSEETKVEIAKGTVSNRHKVTIGVVDPNRPIDELNVKIFLDGQLVRAARKLKVASMPDPEWPVGAGRLVTIEFIASVEGIPEGALLDLDIDRAGHIRVKSEQA